MDPDQRRRLACEAVRYGLPIGRPAPPPSDTQAEAVVRAVFPGAQVIHHWVPTASGAWRCTLTAETRHTRP